MKFFVQRISERFLFLGGLAALGRWRFSRRKRPVLVQLVAVKEAFLLFLWRLLGALVFLRELVAGLAGVLFDGLAFFFGAVLHVCRRDVRAKDLLRGGAD